MNLRKSRFLPPLALVLLLIALGGYYGGLYATDGKPPIHSIEDREIIARVLWVDNEDVQSSGATHIGFQALEIQVLDSPGNAFDDQIIPATNTLSGRTDMENLFRPGDKIIAAPIIKQGKLTGAKAVDLHRQDTLILLFSLFVLALIIYARMVGVKALISFLLTLFIVWEFMVKQILAGASPLGITALCLVLLSGIIIFLVAGFNGKGITAFVGTLAGLGITMATVCLFGEHSGLWGMTQPHVNSLIFSGYYDLDIREIFYAAVVLGASGAAMDIAVDIAAAMAEVKAKRPEISPKALVQSGLTVGRQVMGTMTTTLLLAYSGGYLTLLLFFQAHQPSLLRMVNMKIVAAEIMRTLVGSMGLVMVAPITALVGGLIIGGKTPLREQR